MSNNQLIAALCLISIWIIFAISRWGHWYAKHLEEVEKRRDERHRETIEKLDEIRCGIIDVENIAETIAELKVAEKRA